MAYEDALAIEDSNHGDIDDKNLAGLPVDSCLLYTSDAADE